MTSGKMKARKKEKSLLSYMKIKNVKKSNFVLTLKKNSDIIVKHVAENVSWRGVRVVYGAGLENR